MTRKRPALTSRRLATVTLAHASILFGSLLLGLLAGSSYSVTEVLAALFFQTTDGASAALWYARVPRVGFGALVGAALACSGATFQALLRNPLADPYVLGISGGAALGATAYLSIATLSALLPLTLGVPIAALLGAALTLLLLLSALKLGPSGKQGIYTLLLTGVLFNAFASSLITFLKTIVSAQKAQELLFFLVGTLNVEGTPTSTFIACGVVIGLSFLGILWVASDLNIMALGDDEASALGVEVEKVRYMSIFCASAMVAVAVAYTGLIGFVGLVVPHGLRLIHGSDHRLLLPCCIFGGASFVVLADALARIGFGIFSTTLPVGVVTSLIGAPLFALLMARSFRNKV